ncbi:hypothetical protein VSS74_10470 [Conexibacter stalactiti]|uniref:Uncharacterized protein n=1 Tax=Conexibacter stalactiti TaxID=1940611 RepID=A0ABU4HN88_9ACTN|nr:hypothetical protein [Conexibacter stalactiti]MDW5594763.1 hypothetical protein [Conexibacter stalactiti]MEC5035405.1 hypothetical protein [Conexibacter stalactiti]
MISLITRVAAFVAFVVLGIVWSSEQTETLAMLWAVSFVLVAVSALWSDLEPGSRPSPSAIWAALPGPSKNPDDYR